MKKVLLIGFGLLGVLLIIYLAIVISTNDIYKYVQQVIKQEVIITDEEDPLYFLSGDDGFDEAAYSKYKFKRQNVFHNFRSGQMSVVYSQDIFDENDKLIHQFKNIEMIFYIEKNNGIWTVTKVKRII